MSGRCIRHRGHSDAPRRRSRRRAARRERWRRGPGGPARSSSLPWLNLRVDRWRFGRELPRLERRPVLHGCRGVHTSAELRMGTRVRVRPLRACVRGQASGLRRRVPAAGGDGACDRKPVISSRGFSSRCVRVHVRAQGGGALQPDRVNAELAAGPPGCRGPGPRPRSAARRRRGRRPRPCHEPRPTPADRVPGFGALDPRDPRGASRGRAWREPAAGRAKRAERAPMAILPPGTIVDPASPPPRCMIVSNPATFHAPVGAYAHVAAVPAGAVEAEALDGVEARQEPRGTCAAPCAPGDNSPRYGVITWCGRRSA